MFPIEKQAHSTIDPIPPKAIASNISEKTVLVDKSRVDMLTMNLSCQFTDWAKSQLAQSLTGNFFKVNDPKIVPSFDRGAVNKETKVTDDELILGNVLGTGSFCEVREILAIHLKHEDGLMDSAEIEDIFMPKPNNLTSASKKNDTSGSDDENEVVMSDKLKEKSQIRYYMSKTCQRDGDDGKKHSRYALKQLKVTNREKTIEQGLIDISIEAQFLACLNHPNIIKMRGLAGRPLSPDFGILLDRLYMTLEEKMQFWAGEKKIASSRPHCGCLRFFRRSHETKKLILLQIVTVAYDLSCALKYISGHNLVYRDLKPQNAGFDVRGDIKLFDFGFVKELTSRLVDKDSGMYKLTPLTGSLPYMAPEVFTGKPYGQPSDVFSFGVLLWEMLHHKKANYRPHVDLFLPVMIQTIIKESWDYMPNKRPTFDRIAMLLKAEYEALMSGEKLNSRSELMRDKSMRSFRSNLRNIEKMN